MDDLLLTLHKIEKGEIFDENFKQIFKDCKYSEVKKNCKIQKENEM